MKRKSYNGRQYTDEEIKQADRILRLELSLKSQWLREKADMPWYELTSGHLNEQWQEYFQQMVGDMNIQNENEIKARIYELAETPRRAIAAWLCWQNIKSEGTHKARNNFSKATWYRHMNLLRASGLSDADLSLGEVVAFRGRVLEFNQVESWEELRKAS